MSQWTNVHQSDTIEAVSCLEVGGAMRPAVALQRTSPPPGPPGREPVRPWRRRWIDTSLESPDDITPWEDARPFPGRACRAEARSVAVLFAASISEGGQASDGP